MPRESDFPDPNSDIASPILVNGYPTWCKEKGQSHKQARHIWETRDRVFPRGKGCNKCIRMGCECSVKFGYRLCAACTAVRRGDECVFEDPDDYPERPRKRRSRQERFGNTQMGQDNQFMQPFRGTPLNDFGGLPTTAPMYPPTGTQNVAYNQGNDLPVWGPAFGQQQWQIPAPSHAMDAADRMNVYPPPATDATTGSMGTLPYYTDPYCAPGSIYGPYPSLYMPPTSVGASNNPTPASLPSNSETTVLLGSTADPFLLLGYSYSQATNEDDQSGSIDHQFSEDTASLIRGLKRGRSNSDEAQS